MKTKYKYRDVAQLGSAPCSGRGGRKFESCHPDILSKRVSKMANPFMLLFCNYILTDYILCNLTGQNDFVRFK